MIIVFKTLTDFDIDQSYRPLLNEGTTPVLRMTCHIEKRYQLGIEGGAPCDL